MLLDLDTSARVVAGLKLMDDAILAVLVDLKGNVVADGRAALASHDTTVVLDQAVQGDRGAAGEGAHRGPAGRRRPVHARRDRLAERGVPVVAVLRLA